MANEHWRLHHADTDTEMLLPQDVQWEDELAWSKEARTPPRRALSGTQIIFRGVKIAGRPITLGGEWVWFRKGDLLTLRDWTDTNSAITLTHYDGRVFNVAWRLHDEQGIPCKAVEYLTPEADDAPYLATLKLMTV